MLEINRDGQLWGILRHELPNHLVDRSLRSVLRRHAASRSIYAERIMATIEEVEA